MTNKKIRKPNQIEQTNINRYTKTIDSEDKLHNCLWYRIRLIVNKIFRRGFQRYQYGFLLILVIFIDSTRERVHVHPTNRLFYERYEAVQLSWRQRPLAISVFMISTEVLCVKLSFPLRSTVCSSGV